MGKLSDRTAVITGGASGIGHAIADLFAKEGARVAILDKNGEAAKKAAAHIGAKRDARTFAAAADVGDEKQVKRAFAQVVKALGDVDILVNNAGFDTTSTVAEMSTAMWDEMMRVNLRGVFLCAREVLPAMQRNRWGRIINTSSQLAHKGAETMAHYCAAKAGVMGFTRALAYEAIRHNITVNCINPGPIDTPLVRSLPKAWMKKKLAELPIGRTGRPEEVAGATLLLASEEGAYFVGASMNMNGGDYMI
jgi:3-oxoacyl-[acyl-carrier protein] reductase